MSNTEFRMAGSPYTQRGHGVQFLYLLVALVSWILSGFGLLISRGSIVLCYHGIAAEQAGRFQEQMKRLNQRLKGMLPSVYITFDDAFENLLDNAVPLLNKLHVPAIIFAVPGNLGKSPQWNIATDHPEYNQKTMTAQQLKDIQSDLIKIGSHTQTHPDLSKLPPDQVRWELVESKRNLEQLLGKPVEDLALPYGAYNTDMLHIALEVGYKRVYTLEPRLIEDNQKIGVIGRFSMSPDVWPIEFYLTCCGAYSWLFPFRRFLKWARCIVKGSVR